MVGVYVAMQLAQSNAQEIRIGRSTSLTGPIQANAALYNLGADAMIKQVNERGGVRGRRISVIDKDDAYDPTKCVENTKEFVEDPSILALFQYIGTPTILKASEALGQTRLAMIANISGGDVFKNPQQHPNLFQVRASFGAEVEKMVSHNRTLGISRFAVFYQNDDFGKSVLGAAEVALRQHTATLVLAIPIDRGSVDVAAQSARIAESNAESVLIFVTAKPAAKLIDAVKKVNRRIGFMTLSTVSLELMAKDASIDALRGIGIVQVVPSPINATIGLVAEYQRAMRKYYPREPYSYSSLEGFLNAQVLVEGLNRAARTGKLSRDSILTAMQSFEDVDFGGAFIKFSSTSRRGSNYVDLSVVSREARLLH